MRLQKKCCKKLKEGISTFFEVIFSTQQLKSVTAKKIYCPVLDYEITNHKVITFFLTNETDSTVALSQVLS